MKPIVFTDHTGAEDKTRIIGAGINPITVDRDAVGFEVIIGLAEDLDALQPGKSDRAGGESHSPAGKQVEATVAGEAGEAGKDDAGLRRSAFWAS